jgi:extracellular factor (EF) 3-hydroxypalmitic acid methyl ester biosynthesis protein
MNTLARPTSATLDVPVRALLDNVHEELIDGDGPVYGVIDRLTKGLEAHRVSVSPDVWGASARALTRHPLTHLLHQDPFTRRCFYKPRGYAGDARMLDYIYGHTDDDDSTALGTRILAANQEGPAPCAVRHRKDLLASRIDAAAARVRAPRILAVACGHLREGHASQALLNGEVGELVAFDQDARSLSVVAREFGHLGVTTVHGRIRDLIVGRSDALTGFDLVYAAGLYDYLNAEHAQRLTQTLFSRLNAGGTLLVANFLPGIRDRGYMESFMDWHLVYRSMDEIAALASQIPLDQQASSTTFEDPARNIGFLEMRRK